MKKVVFVLTLFALLSALVTTVPAQGPEWVVDKATRTITLQGVATEKVCLPEELVGSVKAGYEVVMTTGVAGKFTTEKGEVHAGAYIFPGISTWMEAGEKHIHRGPNFSGFCWEPEEGRRPVPEGPFLPTPLEAGEAGGPNWLHIASLLAGYYLCCGTAAVVIAILILAIRRRRRARA